MSHLPYEVVVTRSAEQGGDEFVAYRSTWSSDAQFYAEHSINRNDKVFSRIEVQCVATESRFTVWDSSWR